jgi:hypothetical protein
LKSPKPSRASSVRYSPHMLKRVGNKQHPCPTPLPFFTPLVNPWPRFNLPL